MAKESDIVARAESEGGVYGRAAEIFSALKQSKEKPEVQDAIRKALDVKFGKPRGVEVVMNSVGLGGALIGSELLRVVLRFDATITIKNVLGAIRDFLDYGSTQGFLNMFYGKSTTEIMIAGAVTVGLFIVSRSITKGVILFVNDRKLKGIVRDHYGSIPRLDKDIQARSAGSSPDETLGSRDEEKEKDMLARIQAENESLKKIIGTLTQEKNRLSGELATANEEKNRLSRELATANREREKLRAQLADTSQSREAAVEFQQSEENLRKAISEVMSLASSVSGRPELGELIQLLGEIDQKNLGISAIVTMRAAYNMIKDFQKRVESGSGVDEETKFDTGLKDNDGNPILRTLGQLKEALIALLPNSSSSPSSEE